MVRLCFFILLSRCIFIFYPFKPFSKETDRFISLVLTKYSFSYIIIKEKGRTSNGYAVKLTIFYNSRPWAEGGYCTFMAKIIIKMITAKAAASSFFAICTMLTFHKHTPFHKLGIKPVNIKAGTTAGVNTVKKILAFHIGMNRLDYYTIFSSYFKLF